MRKMIFLALLVYAGDAFCQVKEGVDFGATAVFIFTGNGSGTGFYASDETNGNLYLITAAHVLSDPSTGKLHSGEIILTSYKYKSLVDDKDTFHVDLKQAINQKLFKYDHKTDVAVIFFAVTQNGAIAYSPFVRKLSKSKTFINQMSINDAWRMEKINNMDDIFMAGYPVSLKYNAVFDSTRPLIRHGIVSGIDYKKKWVVTDCPGYHGNSGGPVIARQLEADSAGVRPHYHLIGLASRIIPLEENWYSLLYGHINTTIYNSGYSVIAPVDAILDQIALLGK